jgi:hypothetical protein
LTRACKLSRTISASPSLSFFAWLLLMDRLNTKDLMLRNNRQFEGAAVYSMLHGGARIERLLFILQLPVCYFMLGHDWSSVGLLFTFSPRWTRAKQQFSGPCTIEVVFVSATWNIWKERNNNIFNNQTNSLARFQCDLSLHQHTLPHVQALPALFVRALCKSASKFYV